jgi:hypothetical protein
MGPIMSDGSQRETPEEMQAKRLAPAFAVLLLPLVVVALAQVAGHVLLSRTLFPGLGPWCLVRIEGASAPDVCIKGAENRGSVASGGTTTAGGTGTGTGTGAGPTGVVAGPSIGSRVASVVPRTEPQARAKEFIARVDFAAGTALLWITAMLASVLALIGLWNGGVSQQTSTSVEERRWVVRFCVMGVVAGIAIAYVGHKHNSVRDFLLNGPLTAAQTAKLVAGDAVGLLNEVSLWNLFVGFGAGGLLLGYLAALSIDSSHSIPVADRVTSIQFVLVAGAAILTASVLANKAAISWISGVLDPASSALLLDAFKKVGDFWGLISSLFLVTAIGGAYFAIRGREAKMGEVGQAAGTSAFALRTADSKDFKVLGWLINLLIAFAPVWLSETIFRTFDLFQKQALPQ